MALQVILKILLCSFPLSNFNFPFFYSKLKKLKLSENLKFEKYSEVEVQGKQFGKAANIERWDINI